MSFQGDVGGIGLAELLQSLARGRREGRLTLIGKGTLHSTLGLQGGQLYLLPDPDEDQESWRQRARRAWADDSEQRIDSLRMGEIAQANRIEMLYRLLDSEGAHFRFAPGPLPKSPGTTDGSPDQTGMASEEIHCPPMPVEFLLLEYARLADESESVRATELEDHVVPRALDPGSAPEALRKFFNQCDGVSDLVEIADRLGWPLRQVRNAVAEQFRLGTLRLAQPRELLALTVKELGRAQFERAASRVTAWVETSPAGPPLEEDGALLTGEWKAGRLQRLLPMLDVRTARTLVRRMELNRFTPRECIAHWEELANVFLHGPIIEVHLIALQYRDQTDHTRPDPKELLNASRWMREKHQLRRGGVILRMAAERVTAKSGLRLEIALGLVACGLPEEGSAWVMEAATDFIDEGLYEKAVPPLRALIDADSSNREARRLYSRARNHTVRKRVIKKNTVIGMAFLLALSGSAIVQLRVEKAMEKKLAEITNHLNRPEEALALLQLHFPDNESPEIQTLRQTIFEHRRTEENERRQEWNDQYREAQLECTLGDPVLGMTRALELPEPPNLQFSKEPWPLVGDLFNGLAARMEEQIEELGIPAEGNTDQIHTEEKLAKQVETLDRQAAETGADYKDAEALEAFRARLGTIRELLVRRGEERATAIAERLRKKNLAEQDIQLAAARAHRQAGDLGRAMASYEALLDLDQTGKLHALRELREEIDECRTEFEALKEARRLAHAGDHERAREIMQGTLDHPDLHLLPSRIDSFPRGARATLRDGSVKVTPFQVMSTLDEVVSMTFTLEDHEPIELTLDGPGDHFVFFSRTPERAWTTPHEIHAPPVSVSRDHVVCDRAGTIRRIGASGETVWERKFSSLGGIARTPIFLTKRPGHLLVLTEDGEAWILDAADGELEGPWETGSPPIAGPHPVGDGAVARFADGRVAVWSTRLKPDAVHDGDDPDAPQVATGISTAGLAILRRATDSESALGSPWTPHAVTVGEEVFTISESGQDQALFTVRREGEWQYLAWEAPHAGVPYGRLWIADGAGLRAFTP